MRVWVDTDVGDNPDDAVALLGAEAHPQVELVGVSTVDGDHQRRAACARALVSARVTRGDELGLARAFSDAHPDAVLAIGPLTNLASLVATGVAMPPLVGMGGLLGTVRHRGAGRRVEHNFARDPQAAASVLRACAPVLVVPLDVTVSMCLDDAQLRRLLEVEPALAAEIEVWLAGLRRANVPVEDRRVCLHDPLALLALMEPTLVRIEPRGLRVEADGQVVEVSSAAEQHVVCGVDARRAFDRIVGLLAQGVG